jgi:S1-C subfamily serine protease
MSANRAGPLFWLLRTRTGIFVTLGGAALVVAGLLATLAIELVAAHRLSARPAAAESAEDDGESLSIRALSDRYLGSVITVYCETSLGSAFFVDPEHALTNAHVVCPEGTEMKATFADGKSLPATLVKKDEWLDMALIHVPGAGAKPVPLGDAALVATGDRVVLIGSPRGLEASVSQGIVSHAHRAQLGVQYLQVDAPANPGNSGGPAFDARGRVIGILSRPPEQGRGHRKTRGRAHHGLAQAPRSRERSLGDLRPAGLGGQLPQRRSAAGSPVDPGGFAGAVRPYGDPLIRQYPRRAMQRSPTTISRCDTVTSAIEL